MKYFKILATLLLGSVITFYSCNDNPNSKIGEIPEPLDASKSSSSTNEDTSNSTTTETAQNATGVYHYTCSNGCEGGAGSAVNCENCGQLLTHNKGYHSNTNNTTTPAPFTLEPAAETGKNIAGIWHYTCPKGCAGGSGSAGACTTCGSALAHNQAYH